MLGGQSSPFDQQTHKAVRIRQYGRQGCRPPPWKPNLSKEPTGAKPFIDKARKATRVVGIVMSANRKVDPLERRGHSRDRFDKRMTFGGMSRVLPAIYENGPSSSGVVGLEQERFARDRQSDECRTHCCP